MKRLSALVLAILLTGGLFWCQTASALDKVDTISSLMQVLKEDKQKAVYNIKLNAPFSKDSNGIRETVSSETGEVIVTNNVFDIPGRNEQNLSLTLQYRSRDAKGFAETTKSGSVSYAQSVNAYYDVFDANGYWLRTGGLNYPANETILETVAIDGENWVFTGQLQYVDGTSLINSTTIVNTTRQNSLEVEDRYTFGEGWSLDIPNVEVDGIDLENPDGVYVHLPTGQTYQADFSTWTGLADYELTDILFTKDSTMGNGVDPSAYKLYYANGDAYYFSAKGELLLERDKFGNTITYFYSTINGHRLLTKVVDSIGRAVNIEYNDTVTVFRSGKRTVSLVKSPISGVPGKYYLSSLIDAQGREYHYKYTFQDAAFDLVGKAPANNTYANLIEITYPTGARTEYVWEKGKKNLNSGYMEYFKVMERKDADKDRTYNRLRYQYYNEPDGYPKYKPDAIDESYRYFSTVTDNKGLATKYLFNDKHQPITVQQSSGRVFNETSTRYHLKYNLPITNITRTYNSQGKAFEKVDTFDYDHRGNLIAENHPEKPDQLNSDEHKIFYTYDFAYNVLTGKRFKQDKATTGEIRYSLTADKKEAASEVIYGNGKILNNTAFTYDKFGNLTGQMVEKEPGQWVTTKLEYGQEYQGAYLTSSIAQDVRDADGNSRDVKTSFTYDFNTGNRLSTTDANGHISSLEYDKLDRITKEILPDGAGRIFAYDDLNNILETTNANNNRLVYYYDGLGNLSKVIEPSKNNQLVELTYDDNENLISEIDGNNNLKKLNYDLLTRPTGVSHFDRVGRVMDDTRVVYDEALSDKFGNIFSKVTVTQKGDGQDRINNYYFDTYERLVKQGRFNRGKEELAQYKYDYLGKQTEATDFAGQKTFAQYDALGQLVKTTDGMGSSMKYRYDRLGDMIAQTDSLNRTAYFEYDNLGRKTVEKAPFEKDKFSVTKYYYDPEGNLTKLIDPEGSVTKQYYSDRNFLTAVERVINSKQSNITKYEYDREGNTTKVLKGFTNWTDENFSAYTYQYDSLNRLMMMRDTSNRQTQYDYDNNGNLVKLTDRNKVETSYTYDGLNRLISKQNSKDGKKNAVQISIDKLGQTKQMSDASGTTVFSYDDLGRLNTINYGNGIRQSYSYDKADRVANLQVVQGAMSQINLKYSYDKVGRLTTVNDNGKRFNYRYNQIGQLLEEVNGVTGIKTEYQYYPSGNIKSLRHMNGFAVVSAYEYKYDRRGNQTEKNEGTGATKYIYDQLSRIKTVMEPNQIEDYEYDSLDNIKRVTEIKGTKIAETNYTYDKDSRLLLQDTINGSEETQQRFTYDDNGNQTSKDEVIKRNGSTVSSKSSTSWFNGFNQLSRVRDPNGKFIDYTYNGQGLRTKKDFGDKATNYYYDGGNIIMETDQNNRATAKNIRGLRLIYRENNPDQTNEQFLYYLHNAHGDVTQLLNEKGQVIQDYRYDTFGKEKTPESQVFGGKQSTEMWRKEVEKIDNPFRYAGEYLDEETGNYYLRARYYDPSTQRFTQEDSYSIAFGAAWKEHLYGYAGNNPIRFFDPTGHKLTDWDKSHIPQSKWHIITEATNQWEMANYRNDAADKADARKKTYDLRKRYLKKGEWIDSSGTVHAGSGVHDYNLGPVKAKKSNSAHPKTPTKGTGKTTAKKQSTILFPDDSVLDNIDGDRIRSNFVKSVNEIPGSFVNSGQALKKVAKDPKARQAVKNTGYVVVNYTGMLKVWPESSFAQTIGIPAYLLDSFPDNDTKKAVSRTNKITFWSPSTWMTLWDMNQKYPYKAK